MGKEIYLISYLDSLKFWVILMLKNCASSCVDKMCFLCLFFTKILDLLDYESHMFIYQKNIILVAIFYTYKERYTRHLRTSLNNNEFDFDFIYDSLLDKPSPAF